MSQVTCRHCGATNVRWAEGRSGRPYLQNTVEWFGEEYGVQRTYSRGPHFLTCAAQREQARQALTARLDREVAEATAGAGLRFLWRVRSARLFQAHGVERVEDAFNRVQHVAGQWAQERRDAALSQWEAEHPALPAR